MAERTFHFTNERISSQNLTDGRHVLKVTPGGTNILASIVDGKITQYEAVDATEITDHCLVSVKASLKEVT